MEVVKERRVSVASCTDLHRHGSQSLFLTQHRLTRDRWKSINKPPSFELKACQSIEPENGEKMSVSAKGVCFHHSQSELAPINTCDHCRVI